MAASLASAWQRSSCADRGISAARSYSERACENPYLGSCACPTSTRAPAATARGERPPGADGQLGAAVRWLWVADWLLACFQQGDGAILDGFVSLATEA